MRTSTTRPPTTAAGMNGQLSAAAAKSAVGIPMRIPNAPNGGAMLASRTAMNARAMADRSIAAEARSERTSESASAGGFSARR